MSTQLNQLTIAQAVSGLKQRKFSVNELVNACLKRIEYTNSQINSFLYLNPNLTSEANAADRLLAKNPKIFQSQPLFGIPLALKDNLLTQSMPTTASAKLLSGFIPPYDATVVKRLKNAGALFLGKTNMDAWAHGSSTETSDFGPTHNPWNLDFVPGGSSGGSAAAVIADQCLAAIGTETAGSIRGPAAWCGVTGLKPTYGRVSRYGVIAMASSTDSPGPITKTVTDAATLLSVISGYDRYDATSIKEPLEPIDLDTKSLSGVKVGTIEDYMVPELNQAVVTTLKQAYSVFTDLKASVSSHTLLDPHYSIGAYTILQRSEVSSNLARFDGIRYGFPRSAFSAEAKKRIILGTFSLSTGYYDQYYQKAQKVRTMIVNDFNRAFSKADVLIGPTMPGHATKIGEADKYPYYGELMDMLTEASSIAGLCGISVPAGLVQNLPVGLQIIGPQKSEALVLKIAHAYQQATTHHLQKPPLFSKPFSHQAI